jgi:hypothetical protein
MLTEDGSGVAPAVRSAQLDGCPDWPGLAAGGASCSHYSGNRRRGRVAWPWRRGATKALSIQMAWTLVVLAIPMQQEVATAYSGCCLIIPFGCINGRSDVAAERIDQLCHVLVTVHSPERALSFRPCPLRSQRFFMEQSIHLVTRPVVRRVVEIIDWTHLWWSVSWRTCHRHRGERR